MIIVCYTENGVRSYDETVDMKDFACRHPNAMIDHTFLKEETKLNGDKFNLYANVYGLSPSDYMRRFTNNRGERCVVTGIMPRNRRYPIIVYNEELQKSFKYTADSIRKLLSEERAS